MPEKFSQMSVGATETEEDAKKRQKRGGKGMMKVSEKKIREIQCGNFLIFLLSLRFYVKSIWRILGVQNLPF